VVDLATNRAIKTLTIGGLGLAVDVTLDRLYAASDARIFVLDTSTDTLAATIAAPKGAKIFGLASDPLTHRIYATDIANPRVLVYDGISNTLVAQIPIDAPARFGIAVGPTGHVYVATDVRTGAQLSVVDGVATAVTGSQAAGAFTRSLAVDPTGRAYASSSVDGEVTALDTTTGSAPAKARFGPDQTPGGLTVHPATGALIATTSGGLKPPQRALPDAVPLVQP
jgi:DNA-binding beta-propeller fold protein YncE